MLVVPDWSSSYKVALANSTLVQYVGEIDK